MPESTSASNIGDHPEEIVIPDPFVDHKFAAGDVVLYRAENYPSKTVVLAQILCRTVGGDERMYTVSYMRHGEIGRVHMISELELMPL